MTGPTRRRATVMFIDMVGYSALMHRDEPRALGLVKELEAQLRRRLPIHQGSLVKLLGDGSIAVFDRARDAVEFAVALQRALATRNSIMPPEARFLLRVGIHAGEIVEEAGDILGDAVNIAARLQPLADPGGIALTDPVYEEVRDWSDARGLAQRGVRLKNIAQAVTVHFIPPTGSAMGWWRLRRRRGMVMRAVLVAAAATGAILAAHDWRMRDLPLPVLDNASGWAIKAPEGSTAWISSVTTPGGRPATRVTYRSRLEQWVAIRPFGDPASGDWSRFAGLRMEYRSSGRLAIAVELVEHGRDVGPGESWVHRLTPSESWTSTSIMFVDFVVNTFGRPTAPVDPGRLNTDRIREIRVMADGTGEFNIIEFGGFALARGGSHRPGSGADSTRGRAIASLTSSGDLWPFATGSSTVLIDTGVKPAGAFIRYAKRASESTWGVIVNPSKSGSDWSTAAAIRIRIRGTPDQEVYLSVVERGVGGGEQEGEQWGFPIMTSATDQVVVLPFAQMMRGTWQPPGADNDAELDLARVLRIQIGSSNTVASGSCFISSIELVGSEAVPASGAASVSGPGARPR